MLVSSVFSAEDLCKLPKDAGRCRSLKPMFYFNMETKRCEGFLFKGCNGNANKFENLEECHEACQHHLVLVKLVVAVVVIVIVVATVEVVILLYLSGREKMAGLFKQRCFIGI